MQRDVMVNFGAVGKSLTRLCAATLLKSLEELNLCARGSPQSPGGNAGSVPLAIQAGPTAPKISVPAETVDRLTADAAAAWT